VRCLAALGSVLLVACGGEADSSTRGGGRPITTPGKSALPGFTKAVESGEDTRVAVIPGGRLQAGSTPGDRLRDAAVEMDDVPVELGEFEIERRARETRGLPHDAAAAACRADGMRLCTELEWEHACKGPENRAFASGDAWAPDRPSPFGVHGMGATREWTASAWGATPEEHTKGFVVRGGGSKQGDEARRCAARRPLPAEGDANVGVRCCKGPVNDDAYVMERTRSPFHKLVIADERIAQIVRTIPELSVVHEQPHLFSEGDVLTVLSRAGYHRNEPALAGWTVTWSPIMWSPRQGEQILVVAGRSLSHSFVAALHRQSGDRYTHAGSMILLDDTQALAIGYGGDRRTVAWANCWGCTEGGFLYYEDDRTIRVTHR